MIRITGRKATEEVHLTLCGLDAERRSGNFEWTARVPPAASSDPIADDLLRLGQAVYLADRAVRRSAGIGNALRRLEVTIPVKEPKRFNDAAPLIEGVAEFATCDQWSMRFVPLRGERPGPKDRRPPEREPVDVVALFSGGLDSLCGAAYVASQGLRPVFVTHSPPGRTSTRALVEQVFASRGGPPLSPNSFAAYRLETRESSGKGGQAVFPEHTRRSRPFFFLCLAAATAVRVAARKVWMNENGALALSLPIRADTHGPNMARQAHSFIIHGFSQILAALDPRDAPVPVFDNPFVRKTKGEACLELKGKAAEQSLYAMSCEYTGRQRALMLRWLLKHPKRRHELGDGPQCGLCIPCLVRRAALKRAGIDDPAARYFAHAPKISQMVKERNSAVGVFGTEDPPPLLNMIATNVIHMRRFCQGLLSMTVDEFAVRYLPELRANRALQSAPAPTPAEAHELMGRFAREILSFIR
jgi:hypothetical protein